MPKELTHWRVAEKLATILPSGPAAAVARYRHLFLLGAMAPDILFYYKSGPLQKLFRQTAESLHGEAGADTFAPLKACVRRFGQMIPMPALAFFCGYLCHIGTDCAFHPLVLYFAGKNKYDHHAIETILDLFFLGDRRPPGEITIRMILRQMEIGEAELLELLGVSLFAGNPFDAKELRSGLRQYGSTQRFFWSPFGCWMIRRIAARAPSLRDNVSSYYQRDFYRYRTAFDSPIAYSHPVNGERSCETVSAIAERAAAASLSLIASLLDKNGKEGWMEDLQSRPGPNLFSGLPAGSSCEMAHFAANGAGGLFGWS